jgi:UDP-glucose 4-epimerase
MNPNWLITGGCGFIGSNLIRCLLESGSYNIRILDNLSVGSREDLLQICNFTERKEEDLTGDFEGVELVVGDILNEHLAVKVSRNIDVIVHLAANTGVGPSLEDPRFDCVTNVLGTFNYLEAAKACHVKKFIFASSGASIGEVSPPIHEEMPAHPVSPYGASKLAGEAYCSAYNRSFNVGTVALRFGNVYGPGSKHKSSVVAKFIRQSLAGLQLEIFGDGSQTRDFIFIDDLVRAVILASESSGIGGEVFQIATSCETSISEMVTVLMGILEKNGAPDISLFYGEERLGDVKRNYSDTSKARQKLGWFPNISLEEGLQQTVKSFLSGEVTP